jgi:hypothetical protein
MNQLDNYFQYFGYTKTESAWVLLEDDEIVKEIPFFEPDWNDVMTMWKEAKQYSPLSDLCYITIEPAFQKPDLAEAIRAIDDIFRIASIYK